MHVYTSTYTYVPSFLVALVSNSYFSQSSKVCIPFRTNQTISKAIGIYSYKCITNMCLLQ